MAKRATGKVDVPGKPPVRKKYKKNFLKKVVVRVDFSDVKMELKGPAKAFIGAIKSRFPIAEVKKLIAHSLRIGGKKNEELKGQRNEWLFHAKDRDKFLVIAEDFLAIEISAYKNFELLCEDFLSAVDALNHSYGDIMVSRVGLRYVDHIELDETNPTEWSDYLHADLLAGFNLAQDRKTVTRTFNILETNDGEVAIRFQFGMPNEDYPAVIRKKSFVMDTDAYTNLVMSQGDIKKYLNILHDRINALFESVIKDGLCENGGEWWLNRKAFSPLNTSKGSERNRRCQNGSRTNRGIEPRQRSRSGQGR